MVSIRIWIIYKLISSLCVIAESKITGKEVYWQHSSIDAPVTLIDQFNIIFVLRFKYYSSSVASRKQMDCTNNKIFILIDVVSLGSLILYHKVITYKSH